MIDQIKTVKNRRGTVTKIFHFPARCITDLFLAILFLFLSNITSLCITNSSRDHMLTLTGVSTSFLHLFNLIFATDGKSMSTILSETQLFSSKRRNPAMANINYIISSKWNHCKTLFYWNFYISQYWNYSKNWIIFYARIIFSGQMKKSFCVFSCEEAALEVTFQLVNQSKSVMSCNFCHSDILFVCVCLWSKRGSL